MGVVKSHQSFPGGINKVIKGDFCEVENGQFNFCCFLFLKTKLGIDRWHQPRQAVRPPLIEVKEEHFFSSAVQGTKLPRFLNDFSFRGVPCDRLCKSFNPSIADSRF